MSPEKRAKSRSRAGRSKSKSSRSDKTRPMKTTTRYKSLTKIGSGGIGTVYRAEQTKLDRTVAIKEINSIFDIFAHVDKSDIVDRLEGIVQKQASLNHPNIAHIVDFDSGGEYPFIVTEYAPAGSLRRLIDQDERPSLEVVLKYFIQILGGLKQAHDHDLIHGNLKPENILLDKTGNTIITDFGLSGILDQGQQQNNQVYVGVGTVAYLSPEQFQNPNEGTVQTDIYSLGIMFYEMLTGKLPGRRSPMPSSLFPEIPKTFDDIFDRMCRDNASNRYDSVQDIFDELYEADDVIELIDPRTGYTFLESPLPEREQPAPQPQEDKSESEGTPRSEAEASSTNKEDSSTESQASSSTMTDPESKERSTDEADSDEEEPKKAEASAEDNNATPSSETPDDNETEESEEDGVSADDVASKLDQYEKMFD